MSTPRSPKYALFGSHESGPDSEQVAAELRRRGCECTLIECRQFHYEKDTTVAALRRALAAREELARARRLLDRINPDVVVLRSLGPEMHPILWACRDLQIPVVLWCAVAPAMSAGPDRALRVVMRATGGGDATISPKETFAALAAPSDSDLATLRAKGFAAPFERVINHALPIEQMTAALANFLDEVIRWTPPIERRRPKPATTPSSVARALRCPACEATELQHNDTEYQCSLCGESYPLRRGVPDFRPRTLRLAAEAGAEVWSRWQDARRALAAWRKKASPYRRPLPPAHRLAADWANERRSTAGLPVIDVGCGRGVLGHFFPPGEYLGIEPEPVAASSLPILRAFGERLPLGDATAGAVLSLAAFDYAADPAATLAEFRRILAPAGALVLLLTLQTADAKARLLESSTLHVSYFTAEDVDRLLDEARFSCARRERFGSIHVIEASPR